MKIAVVGNSPTAKHAPFSDPEWTVYGIAEYMENHPRVDLGFQVHDYTTPQELAHQESLGIPLVVCNLEGHERFPMREASELIGREYFTSSIAYMLAYAILKNPTHIGIWGVEMATDDAEYFYQQPCVMAWIGVAIGRGIDVYVPPRSPLLNSTYVYGRVEKPAETDKAPFTSEGFHALAEQHRMRCSMLREDIRKIEESIQLHDGAAQSYERMEKVARAVEGGQLINHLTETAILR